jgi:hypothetical protein
MTMRALIALWLATGWLRGVDVILLRVEAHGIRIEVRQDGCTIIRSENQIIKTNDDTCRALIEAELERANGDPE